MRPLNYRTLIILALTCFTGCGSAVPPTATAPAIAVGQTSSKLLALPATSPSLASWLLHLPGIGGEKSIDQAMTRGFKQGGFTGEISIYDWTENDTGLHALMAYERNHKEARIIAQKITDRYDKDPAAPIYLSSHSGGAGLAVWALEDLPSRVKIADLIMLAPALSPAYDLSAALSHVSGKLYVFSSLGDQLVLGTGCRLLGTIDGVRTDAAGRVGFVRPPTGDVGQYAKVVALPYRPDWVYLNNYGDHVGPMSKTFARVIIAPLVLSGTLPVVSEATTRAAAPTPTASSH